MSQNISTRKIRYLTIYSLSRRQMRDFILHCIKTLDILPAYMIVFNHIDPI